MNKLAMILPLVFLTPNLMAEEQPLTVAEFFNQASFENMEEICDKFYHKDIVFEDPLGRVEGMEAMVKYYKNLYQNVISIKFNPISEFVRGDEQVFVWKMDLKHKTVGDGEPILMDGVSVLKYKDGKVIYHRDYFDLGVMLYENIPVLGSIIRWIKRKAHG